MNWFWFVVIPARLSLPICLFVLLLQVKEAMYVNETATRAHYFKDSLVRNEQSGRYLCPFPVCGKSFRSQDAAFEHLHTHEQKLRFFASTPLQDSLLSSFWPQGASWVDSKEYSRRVLPPGAIPCSVKGCVQVFSSKQRLEFHLNTMHRQVGMASVLRGKAAIFHISILLIC